MLLQARDTYEVIPRGLVSQKAEVIQTASKLSRKIMGSGDLSFNGILEYVNGDEDLCFEVVKTLLEWNLPVTIGNSSEAQQDLETSQAAVAQTNIVTDSNLAIEA